MVMLLVVLSVVYIVMLAHLIHRDGWRDPILVALENENTDAKARIEELEKRVQSARPFVEAAAEEAITGPEWAEKAREWLRQGG